MNAQRGRGTIRLGRRRVAALAGVTSLAALATPMLAAPAGAAGSSAVHATGSSAVHATAAPTFSTAWQVTLPDQNRQVALSSPTVANLDGQPSAVVGDIAGRVYALHLAGGGSVAGWPVVPDGLPIASPPSVSGSTVYVGSGDAGHNTGGGYNAFNANGSRRWRTTVPLLPNGGGGNASVQTGLAIGQLQGVTSAVSGTLGQQQDELNADSGGVQPGFPWFEADSNFTTPAIADLYGNGQNEIIEGGDSTAGNAYNTPYSNGGHLRILSQTGNLNTGSPSGGLICQFDTNQTVQSSPAVGTFLAGNAVGITFGTGVTYGGASQTNQLLAVDNRCGVRWAATLGGSTNSSPAVVNALGGNGEQIAEATGNGLVYLLNGNTGATIWSTSVGNQVIGNITSGDFTGAGYQDLLVPTIHGVYVLDGRSGAQIAILAQNYGFQNSALVTQDPNGAMGVTVAGYDGSGSGYVAHYTVAGSNGSLATEQGAWPEFHHDPQLTGNAGTPQPVVEVACNPPAGGANGYDMVASDGGVFNFGNLPYCGSTGNVALARPIVGGAVSNDGGGYWLVASDGGIFSFDDARFHGSLGNVHLTSPIVAMAPTPSGNGYWLVGADGGVFTFGDAGYYGSLGNMHLASPIVGITSTPDGRGYILAGADGGVFTFGDAQFHGSAGNAGLVRPVVGIAIDPATGGYWMTASDGGVFSYGAPFYGSAGGARLAQPVVGLTEIAGGSGYRLVAADGGMFNYGNAPFYGSLGNVRLARPVVAISGLPK